jgi:hypothetical protein
MNPGSDNLIRVTDILVESHKDDHSDHNSDSLDIRSLVVQDESHMVVGRPDSAGKNITEWVEHRPVRVDLRSDVD